KAFVALFAVVFSAMLGMGIIAPLMPLYAVSMGASGLSLGIMYAGFALSRAIFMPFIGRLSDSRGRKRFMVIGLLAYITVSLFYSLATNIYQLTSIRIFHGLASSMIVPIAQAYIGDLIPEGKEGKYMNLFSASAFAGMGLGPLLGGGLADAFFLDAAFYAMAGLSALALLLLLPFVPPSRSAPAGHPKTRAAPFSVMLRDNRVKALSIYRASRAFWRQGIVAFLPIMAVSGLAMSRTSIGLVLSVYMVTGGVAQGLIGPLADRYDKKPMIITGAVTAPVLLFLIPYATGTEMLLVILLGVALLSALSRAATMALTVELGRKFHGMGSVLGLVNSAMSLGMVVGPITLGYAMDAFGMSWVFRIGAIEGIGASLLTAYFLLRKEAG
ncbi:MAG: MFS transporter, partial [Dehalococcoidia bacterium]